MLALRLNYRIYNLYNLSFIQFIIHIIYILYMLQFLVVELVGQYIISEVIHA